MAAGDLITDVWQIEWRTVLFGFPATSLAVTNLTGWLDLPPTRSSPTDRPGRHGTFPSQLRAAGRTVEVELSLMVDDPAALPALYNATALGEDDQEEALVLWAGTDTPQLVFGRCERRAVATDHAWSVGDGVATLQWACSDPRRYSVQEHTTVIGLPATSVDGLIFPLVFPLTFGVGQSGGQLLPTNAGNVPTWPTFTVAGPVTGPTITNADTGQQLVFNPAFTVADGQQMVIDTDLRTVLLNGVNVRASLQTAQWFPLAANGATTIAFTSAGGYDPDAALTITWRDSWL